jgi:hypothetical protein
VQTQANGRARIGLADGSTLLVKPTAPSSSATTPALTTARRRTCTSCRQRSAVGPHRATGDGTTNVVETPKTKNTMGEQTSASFGVNPEGTEEIRVRTGAIETPTSRRKDFDQGGEYVSVNNSGRSSPAQKLLDVPQPAKPHDLEQVFVGPNGARAWR